MSSKMTRRELTKKSLYLGLGLPFIISGLASCNTKEGSSNTGLRKELKGLNILILGGTSFLGPHQIAYALSRGHKISTFTRGKSKPTVHRDLFDQIESLIGDRENNLTVLVNRKWDVVIDNSGHNVEWTKQTAALLKDNVGLYLYTSSTGVYFPYLGDDIDETTNLVKEEPKDIQDEVTKTEYWYGVMKTNSELAAINSFGADRTIIVRPTYMMGPGDKTDRFIHWPVRLSKGGEIMVPGKQNDPVQYVDVRDVAKFMIDLIENKVTGIYNAVGPKEKETMTQFVQKAKQAFEVESNFVHIGDYEFLKLHKTPYLVPWIMPEGDNYGSARINNQKGINAGLNFRPLRDSILDTHKWWYSDALTDERRNEFELKEGSVLLREQVIIDAWKKSKG